MGRLWILVMVWGTTFVILITPLHLPLIVEGRGSAMSLCTTGIEKDHLRGREEKINVSEYALVDVCFRIKLQNHDYPTFFDPFGGMHEVYEEDGVAALGYGYFRGRKNITDDLKGMILYSTKGVEGIYGDVDTNIIFVRDLSLSYNVPAYYVYYNSSKKDIEIVFAFNLTIDFMSNGSIMVNKTHVVGVGETYQYSYVYFRDNITYIVGNMTVIVKNLGFCDKNKITRWDYYSSENPYFFRDLRIANYTLTEDNRTVNFSMVLDNFGIASFGFYVDFYIDEEVWHRRWVRWVPTHGNITMNVTFKNLSYGYHNLKCIIDAEDVVPEMSETNNTLEMTFRVNRPPYVDIEVNSSEPYINETVVFYGHKCYDLDGEIISYFWDFGDGAWSEGQNASHRYSERGMYNVTLKVMDNDGMINMTNISIHVVNRPPQINILNNKSIIAYVNETLNFSAFGTYDADNDTLDITWDFGDGNVSHGMNVSHTYRKNGTYIVRLIVSDGNTTVGATITVEINEYEHSEASADEDTKQRHEYNNWFGNNLWYILLTSFVIIAGIILSLIIYHRRKFKDLI